MAERPAVNASPLIFLARGGLLELLRLAGSQIAVPREVVQEIGRKGADDVTARALASTPWLVEVKTDAVPPSIQEWGLGAGESAVLTWAQTHGTEAIVDDLAARRCAAACGIKVRGTLGLVLTAKRRGQIEAARPILLRLRQTGMYLSDRVVDQALALVNE